MTISEQNSWAVLLSKPEFLDWPALGKAIASFKKIPLQDAAHLAKASWGIVAENVEESEAHELSRQLKEAGLGGVVVPASSLVSVRGPNVIRHVDLTETGLQVEAKPNEHRVIPWSYFCLAAVSVIKKNTAKIIKIQEGPSAGEQLAKAGIMLATGIPLPMKKKRTIEKKVGDTELFFFLDLFLKQNGLRIRLDAQSLDYSFLRERKQFGAHVNFRLLLTDVGKNAAQAIFNRGMRVLLGNQPVTSAGYEALSDLEKECRWLLTLANIKE